MDSESVLEVVAILADANVHVCLDGGWGVDALLGEQTREHGDLDVIVGAADVATLRERLATAGFREKPDGTGTGFVLADARRREVRCLSPDAQVQCHGQGYPPTENDLRDMERLQERFGVVLPLALCRDEGRRVGSAP